MTTDTSLPVELWNMWSHELKLLGSMCYGHLFKLVCTSWDIDKETAEPLRFPRCLFGSPERFRTVGSWMVMGLVFILPDDTVNKIMHFEWAGFPIGYFSLFVFGFVADDVFVILPAFISTKLRAFARDKLGIHLNGKPHKLPEDFPQ